MGNCLVVRKGGISDDELQILSKAISYTYRDSTTLWELIGEKGASVTLTERTLIRYWSNDRFEYKFLDEGVYILSPSIMWGVEVSPGYRQYYYKYTGGGN